MELDQMPQPGPGLCGSDRDVFERVWRRVMPEDQLTSPIEVIPEAEYGVPAPAPMPPAMPELPVQPLPVPPPAPRRAEPEDIRCLGPSSAVHGAELQEFILEELRDHRTYQALAQRAPGRSRQTLAGIAADEMRHAKRLSAAYFLISGVRYWPLERAACRNEGGWLNALRCRFLEEQKGEAAYRAAAGRTGDPCLRELYLELAEDENSHGWLLRGILEAM